MMNVDYPFRLDRRGLVATTGHDQHIRQMIEQVLFTSPGERVNRPTFGCDLRRLLFVENQTEVVAAAEAMAQAALQQWLHGVIHVERLDVAVSGESVSATVGYTDLRTSKRHQGRFTS